MVCRNTFGRALYAIIMLLPINQASIANENQCIAITTSDSNRLECNTNTPQLNLTLPQKALLCLAGGGLGITAATIAAIPATIFYGTVYGLYRIGSYLNTNRRLNNALNSIKDYTNEERLAISSMSQKNKKKFLVLFTKNKQDQIRAFLEKKLPIFQKNKVAN